MPLILTIPNDIAKQIHKANYEVWLAEADLGTNPDTKASGKRYTDALEERDSLGRVLVGLIGFMEDDEMTPRERAEWAKLRAKGGDLFEEESHADRDTDTTGNPHP